MTLCRFVNSNDLATSRDILATLSRSFADWRLLATTDIPWHLVTSGDVSATSLADPTGLGARRVTRRDSLRLRPSPNRTGSGTARAARTTTDNGQPGQEVDNGQRRTRLYLEYCICERRMKTMECAARPCQRHATRQQPARVHTQHRPHPRTLSDAHTLYSCIKHRDASE